MSTRTSSSLWYRILLMAVIVAGLTRPAAAQKCWSATGATAVINIASLGIATQSATNLTVLGTAPLPATLEARYTVSGIQDAPSNALNGKILFMRFVDNGQYSQVRAVLRQVHIDTQVAGTNVLELQGRCHQDRFRGQSAPSTGSGV